MIYVLNEGLTGNGNFTVYPPLEENTGDLDEAPVATIAGPNAGLHRLPMGIAVFGPAGS
jgi:hypothetical protein